jgi:non-specific serine/threonine protein kinase/serine/threonine-protein kinase
VSAEISASRWQRIKSLFQLALDRPAAERAALLELEAPDDVAVRQEVESLLAAHEQCGTALDAPPIALKAELLAASGSVAVGDRVGAYRIVEMLGAGGMGEVFRAVRDDESYHAEVAIKLVRADLGNAMAGQRFRTERQILAGLDHPHIARMLDGGTSAAGWPYVVMELVRGEPIDRYLERRGASVRERVRLFLQVCAAVSYAHQHLVIHRDLKPNNILVTDAGSVKLLDFGIAKLLNMEVTPGGREETATQMRVMTLEYASPEQVSGAAVTTASDVYSLGVMLYRLLTGESPYGAGISEARRLAEIVGDTTPTRPSLVGAARRQRGAEIAVDLDDILLMALRKDPRHRYSSVEQFSNDLRNFLAGLPVTARGNSLRYRWYMFIRRHRLQIAAAAVVTLSLLGGLWIAIREAREAERQRLVAQRHFDSVRQLANTLLFTLHDEIAPLSGSTKSRQILVTTSLEYLNTLYSESGNAPSLQLELAVAYRKVGDIQGSELGPNIGDPEGALQSYEKSAALLESLMTGPRADGRTGAALAQTYLHQARLLLATRGAEQAYPVVQKSLELSKAHAGAFTDDRTRLIQLSGVHAARAHILDYLDRTPDALAALGELIALCEAYSRAHPDDPQAYKSLTAAYNNAALVVDARLPLRESFERPIALLTKAMDADQKLVDMEPGNPAYRWGLAETRTNLGDALYWHGEHARAAEVYRQVLAVTREGDPNNLRGRVQNAFVQLGLARSLVKLGGHAEAAGLFAEAESFLLERAVVGNSLQIEYGLAMLGIRRGEMYVALADNPTSPDDERLRHWRQARDSLAKGVEIFRRIGESVALTGPDKSMMDDGVAALARSERAVARLAHD